MTTLKRYTSFKALKANKKSSIPVLNKENIFSEFDAFLKRLQAEYSKKKKPKANNGKYPN